MSNKGQIVFLNINNRYRLDNVSTRSTLDLTIIHNQVHLPYLVVPDTPIKQIKLLKN